MKTIDELGISKAPWGMPRSCLSEGFVYDNNGRGYAVCHISGKPSEQYERIREIASKRDPSVANTPPMAWKDYANPNEKKANARLIAAAPELYECLREAVMYAEDIDCDPDGCDECLDRQCCRIRRWRAALAKASGEEMTK